MGALDGMTGTSSFGGVAFWETTGDARVLRPGQTARVVKQPIPYGNLANVQVGGVDRDDLEIEALVKSTDWPALYALVGNTGALAMLGDASRTALLASARQAHVAKDGYLLVSLAFVFA